jgi:hypothetical protein
LSWFGIFGKQTALFLNRDRHLAEPALRRIVTVLMQCRPLRRVFKNGNQCQGTKQYVSKFSMHKKAGDGCRRGISDRTLPRFLLHYCELVMVITVTSQAKHTCPIIEHSFVDNPEVVCDEHQSRATLPSMHTASGSIRRSLGVQISFDSFANGKYSAK